MTGTPVSALVMYALAGLVIGNGYRAVRTRTESRAYRARHPEMVVLAGLVGRIAGLAGLTGLISGGGGVALGAMAVGASLAWLSGDPPDPSGHNLQDSF